MPNIKSAEKRVEVTKVKTLNNKVAKSALKTSLKKAENAISSNSEDMSAVVNEAIKKIDMAVADGLLHKNNAARKKSKLAVKLNKVKA